ncbi:MAG: hypothetical protein ACXWLM_00750 [Myxococcales bacterium]
MKYVIWCALVLGGYVAIEARGTDLTPRATHATIPASVRSSPGGYRSYHFWHSGYQGGK